MVLSSYLNQELHTAVSHNVSLCFIASNNELKPTYYQNYLLTNQPTYKQNEHLMGAGFMTYTAAGQKRTIMSSCVFCQVQPCSLRKLAEEVRKARGFMPAQPAETEKTATFSSGKMTR